MKRNEIRRGREKRKTNTKYKLNEIVYTLNAQKH